MLTPDDLRGAVTLKGRIDINEFSANHSNFGLIQWNACFAKHDNLLISRGEGKMAGRSGIYARPSFRYALKREPGEHSAGDADRSPDFRASSALVPG
jgi:hypothetical protein